MALNMFADGVSQGIGSVTFNGHWTGAVIDEAPLTVQFQWGYAAFSFLTPQRYFNSSGGSWSDSEGVDKDRDAKYRSIGQDDVSNKQSSNIQFKTYADLGAFPSGLTPGTPTQVECSVSGSVVPNTRDSFCDVVIEYRVLGTSPWTVTAPVAVGLQGTSPVGLGGTLTGLTPGTTYEARYRASRNTTNDQTFYSNIGVFTTASAGSPKTIVVPAPAQGQGSMPIPTILSGSGHKTIEAPLMVGSGQMLIPVVTSPELVAFVDLEIYTADEAFLLVVL